MKSLSWRCLSRFITFYWLSSAASEVVLLSRMSKSVGLRSVVPASFCGRSCRIQVRVLEIAKLRIVQALLHLRVVLNILKCGLPKSLRPFRSSYSYGCSCNSCQEYAPLLTRSSNSSCVRSFLSPQSLIFHRDLLLLFQQPFSLFYPRPLLF